MHRTPSRAGSASPGRLGSWVLLCALLGATACAGRIPAVHQQAPALSALPTPAALLDRQPSDSLGYIYGAEHSPDLPSANTVDSDVSRSMTPAESGPATLQSCAFCIFRAPLSDSGPLRWQARWRTPPAAGTTFIAAGNSAANRWDWHALADPAAAVDLGDSADYALPDGSVLLALVTVPGAGSAVLDYFTLEARPESGWRFAEVFSRELDGSLNPTYLVQAAVVNGNPCLLFKVPAGTEPPSNDFMLAVSSTPSGASSADWQVYPVDVPAEQLAAVGTGYALTYSVFVFGDLDELHYCYSDDPATGFSDEVVVSVSQVADARLGSVAGKPAIAYGAQITDGNSTNVPYFATSAAASGGPWVVSPITVDGRVSNAAADGFCPPGESGGLPVLGYYDVVQSQFTVAAADQALPTGTGNWTTLHLGDGYDSAYMTTSVDGKLTFASEDSIVFAPSEIEFWTYQLTGSDPAAFADWTLQHYDGLGLGQGGLLGIVGVGGDMAFIHHSSGEGSPALDGSLSPVRLWRSAAPGNAPADWQRTVVTADDHAVGGDVISVGGQPAFAELLTFKPDMAGVRTVSKLLWSVYVE